MSARVLCNELHDLLVELHGAETIDGFLHPPTVAEVRRERAVAAVLLGGEVG